MSILRWNGNNPANYRINATLGTLEVTAATLTVTIKDRTLPYNGSEQYGYDAPASVTGTGSTIETDEYKIEGLAEGQVLTISGYTAAAGTNVDTYDGSFDGAVIKVMSGTGEEAADITGFYTISTPTAGKLTIEPVTLSITAKDKT